MRIDSSSRLIRLGRDEYKYVEGDRSLILFIELLTGKPELAIHSSSIDKWLPPDEDQTITEEERQQVTRKIAQYLAERGRSVMIQ
jgi:Immunity protein 74